MWTLRVGVVLVLSLVLGACSGDVLESDEYIELSAETESLRGEVTKAETAAADAEAAAAEADVRADEAAAAAAAAETALAATDELREWPQAVKDMFIDGCTQEPEEGFTAQQQEQFCSCMVDELEAKVAFDEFMLLSVAMVDPSASLSPVTGLPVGLDDNFAQAFVAGATTCVLELE